MYLCLNRGTTGAGLPLEQFVRLAADAGFQGADVDLTYGQQHGPTALGDLYASAGLRFGGWAPPLDPRTEPERRDEMLRVLRSQVKVAADLRIDACCTWIMPSSPRPFIETWADHVDALRPAAQALADHGLRLGLEFVAPYHLRRVHPHEFIYTPGLMLELAEAIGPNVGLLVDGWHCHNAAVPWEQVEDLPPEKIVWCHLNDAPDRPLTELVDGRRLLPGEGVLDLPRFLGALKTAGYQGPVSVESFFAVKDLPPPEAARRAWAATRKVLETCGLVGHTGESR